MFNSVFDFVCFSLERGPKLLIFQAHKTGFLLVYRINHTPWSPSPSSSHTPDHVPAPGKPAPCWLTAMRLNVADKHGAEGMFLSSEWAPTLLQPRPFSGQFSSPRFPMTISHHVFLKCLTPSLSTVLQSLLLGTRPIASEDAKL